MPSPSEGGETLAAKSAVFYVSRSRFLMIRCPKNLTPCPPLIVPEHGCAFELQNHREYGVSSSRAKGVHEKKFTQGIFVS
jgi:hypothetical protein